MTQNEVFANALSYCMESNDLVFNLTKWTNSEGTAEQTFAASWSSAGESLLDMAHGLDNKDKQSVTILKSILNTLKIEDFLTKIEVSEKYKITAISYEDKSEWTVDCQKIEHKQIGNIRK